MLSGRGKSEREGKHEASATDKQTEGGTSEKAMVVSPRKTLNALIGGVYVRRGDIHFPRPFITL